MTVKTQGTDLYAIDPADNTLIVVSCVTSIDGIDSAIDQIETTCLNAQARTYEGGLATPGTASFGINIDPKDPSHFRLYQLKKASATIKWALGWAEQPGLEPTIGVDGDFDLPEGRSWLIFEGYMNAYPFNFAQNSVVQSTVGIQISGDPELIPAVLSS